ncbi:MAG: N-6 DNA methylase [Muribaculum sp.]|nr:N-6 DNA methylase [Muribaculum sp.]
MTLKERLEHIFSNDYPGTETFITEVIKPIFGDEIEYKHTDLAELPQYAERARKAGLKHIRYIGDLTEKNLSSDNIVIFDVTVDDSVYIERSRVNIQQLIRSVIQEYQILLMVFHYENTAGKQWRFSYAYKGVGRADSTSPKRYTYVFGKGYRGRTAAERFELLAESERGNADFEKAFSVEALSNEFFDKYRNIYADFVELITGKRYEKEKGSYVEKFKHEPDPQFASVFYNQDKTVRDYVKKMFGRIVFLYFLQRKGWLYYNDGKSNPAYMHDLFADSSCKDNFLDGCLETLFFRVLNTDKPNRGIGAKSLPGGAYIPYLNGGLFQEDDIDRLKCVFPADYFQKLFDFLDSYNFTIDENDREDAEIGIDPEMLGHIFENLLEDNKDKGAFYTPKEIVEYMCRESIIAYLQDDAQSDEENNLIRDFIETQNVDILNESQRNSIEERLLNVKICDPAIGSGAFPMGLVNLLSKLFIALRTYKTIDQAKMKRYIMQNSIYGVDIEKGAVDIARLRFWLAMVVDEVEPQPLPNLHFKIMQGNSLLEHIHTLDLSNLMNGEFGRLDFVTEEERGRLRRLLNRYYTESNHDVRDKIMHDIKQTVMRLILNAGQDMDILLAGINVSENDRFFLWHTWFSDVFSRGGFDIVIGNPPYISVEGMKPEEKEVYKKYYDVFYKRCDIFALFMEMALRISSSKGVVSFIIPSVVHSNLSYKKLRDLILNRNWLQEVCYTGGDVFNAPTVDTTILRCKKSGVSEITIKKALDFANPKVYTVPNGYFKTFGNIISVDGNQDTNSIFSKLFNKEFALLSQYFTVFQGIVTGNNPAFIFETEEDAKGKVEDSLLHPMCHGRDIGRYCVKNRDRRILYLNNSFKIEDFPLTRKWLEQFKSKLYDRREAKKGVIPWYGLQWPRVKSELDLKEKILLQNTRNESLKTRIVAALDCCGVYATQGINFIIPTNSNNEISLRYLIGILNSKLINYLFSTKFLNLAIKADYVKQLRIPIAKQKRIEQLVSEIMESKRANHNTDTFVLESEIDHIVYHLYELTYEEVLIVDPQFPISREDYDNFKRE